MSFHLHCRDPWSTVQQLQRAGRYPETLLLRSQKHYFPPILWQKMTFSVGVFGQKCGLWAMGPIATSVGKGKGERILNLCSLFTSPISENRLRTCCDSPKGAGQQRNPPDTDTGDDSPVGRPDFIIHRLEALQIFRCQLSTTISAIRVQLGIGAASLSPWFI